jgi:hypothetical protein
MPGLDPIEEAAPPTSDAYVPINPNPQPISESITFNDALTFDVSATVYVRQRWQDAWTQRDELVCTDCNWTAAPTIPTASIQYRYGPVVERGASARTVRGKASLSGWFVRIIVHCVDGDRKWHGFVDDIADSPSGIVVNIESGTPVSRPTGVQTISCVGMIASFNRSRLFNSFYKAETAFQTSGYTGIRVANSPPIFNPRTKISDEPGEARQIKNRTPGSKTDVKNFRATGITTAFARQSYIHYWPNLYSTGTTLGEYWTPRQIVEYLLAWHGPRDDDNKERLPVWLYNNPALDSANQPLPDWGQPEIDCEGLTLFDALNRVMSVNNSLGYWCWVDDTSNRIYLEPFTTLNTELVLDTGKEVRTNARQTDINAIRDPASSVTIQKNESSLANQIVCRGAPRIAIFTAQFASAGLVANWSGADVTAFEAAFPITDLRSEYIRRDALEQPRWRALYRQFVFANAWNWKYRAGAAGAATVDLFQTSDDLTGEYANDLRYLPYPGRMRVLPHLPLKTGIDYSTGTTALRTEHNDSLKAFRDIEVYGFLHGPTFTTTLAGKPTLWTDHAKRDILYDANDPDYSLRVRPLASDVGLGISVNVDGGPQSILGPTAPAPHIPLLPYAQLDVTLAIEDDREISQHFPAVADLPSVDGVLRKVFDFGDAYQLIELMEGTIVGFDNTAFKRRDTRYFIRDDRPRLLELAKQLSKWYATARNVARLASRRGTARLWPGQLVKKIEPTTTHETTCNCVITEVSISLPIGNPDSQPRPQFQVVTSRGEVDPMFFQPRL